MNDREIDEIFERAGEAPYNVDPGLLGRVSASMEASLRPVRPMAPAWMLVSGLLSISAGIAIAGACSMGLYGIRRLSGVEVGTIFPALGILTLLAALLSVGEMTPGSRRWINPAMLPTVAMVGWIAVDAILFRDYGMSSFMRQGMSCLGVGLGVAIPSGVASWALLRRGFAVRPAAAGLAAGTLAGLAGVTMLELHCPNFLAPHVMVWHTAVIPVSTLVGGLLAFILRRP